MKPEIFGVFYSSSQTLVGKQVTVTIQSRRLPVLSIVLHKNRQLSPLSYGGPGDVEYFFPRYLRFQIVVCFSQESRR